MFSSFSKSHVDYRKCSESRKKIVLCIYRKMDTNNWSGKTLTNLSMESLSPKRHPKFLIILIVLGLLSLGVIFYVKSKSEEATK